MIPVNYDLINKRRKGAGVQPTCSKYLSDDEKTEEEEDEEDDDVFFEHYYLSYIVF